MKKLLMMAMAMLMAVTMSAQSEKGGMAVGGNLNIGLDHGYTNFGIGAKFSYNFINHLRGEASLDYFFPKDDVSQLGFNFNLHWVFDIKEKHGLYPIAGFAYLHQHADVFGGSVNTNHAGFNLGVGYEFRVSEHFKFGPEVKLQCLFGDGDSGSRGIIGIGAAYMF